MNAHSDRSEPATDPRHLAPTKVGVLRRAAHPTAVAIGALAVVALVAAGCGDDDASNDASGSNPTVELCDAALAVEVAPEPEVDFETATEEEIGAALMAFGQEVMRPLADDVVASAPDEVSDEVAVLSAAVDNLAAGDPGAFDEPDVVAAAATYDAFVDDECGWTVLDVTALDYSFDGIPTQLDAGPTRIRMTNEGAEFHEVLLLRRNPGADLPVEELFELSEEEGFALVTPAGPPAVAPPGGSNMAVYDIEAGEYIAICMIPTGITSEDSEPGPDALPHAAHGMVTEFTVS